MSSQSKTNSIPTFLYTFFLRLFAVAPSKKSSVILASYPKIMYLYPTGIVALLCATLMLFVSDETSTITKKPFPEVSQKIGGKENTVLANAPEAREKLPPQDDASEISEEPEVGSIPNEGFSVQQFCGILFLGALAFNSLVITFDFPRTSSLTILFGIGAALLGTLSVFQAFPGFFPSLFGIVPWIDPHANACFYFLIAAGYTIITLVVLATRRFNYWEITGNELVQHNGILGSSRRYSSNNLKVEKEILDVFEYFLMGAGRIVLYPGNELRAIIIEDVPFVNTKEKAILENLRELDVQISNRNTL